MESTVLPASSFIKATVSSLLSTTANHLSSSTSYLLSSTPSPFSSSPNSFDTTNSRGLFTFSDIPHLSQLSHTHSILPSPSYSSWSSATSSPFGPTLSLNSDPTTLMTMRNRMG